jgi:hypothetical protein
LTRGVCSSGGGIRTPGLRVMSPTSCRCSTPRRGGGGGGAVGGGPPATATSPTACKPQYPAALAWGTTGFGMGPGGSPPRSLTPGTPPPTVDRPLVCEAVNDLRVGFLCAPWHRPMATWATPTVSGKSGPPTPMRTAPLRRLPAFHARPLDPVVCRGAYLLKGRSDRSSPGGVPT